MEGWNSTTELHPHAILYRCQIIIAQHGNIVNQNFEFIVLILKNKFTDWFRHIVRFVADIINKETAGAIMTTVYIDVLFIVNMIMDLMIHTATCLLRRRRVVVWRILCAAAAESVCALGLFFAYEYVFLYYGFAVILFIGCIWFTIESVNIRDFIKNICATFFCAIIFGGIFFLIYRFADIGSVVVFNNNVLYLDIPIFSLLCVSGICLGVIVLVSRSFVRVISPSSEYNVQVQFFDNKKQAKAKIDTGNDMIDPVSGYPVLLANKKWLVSILPKHVEQFIEHGNINDIDPKYQSRLRIICCKTATGTGVLPAIRPDCIELTYNGKKVTISNVLIAISKTFLNEYDLLLTPHVFKEIEDDVSVIK